ncbi:MAG: MFS transporter [Bacteroidota bacterium]
MRDIAANTWKLILYRFLHHLVFAYVIERLYWLDRGISISQTVHLEIIYAAVVVVLDVPTGALADAWSRKWLLVASAACMLGELVIITFSRGFPAFALAIALVGLGQVLASGTFNALLYDSLATAEQTAEFETVLGRIILADRTALIIGALAGGAIAARYGLSATYRLSLLSFLGALGVALTLREPARGPSETLAGYWRHIPAAVLFLRRQGDLWPVLLLRIVVGAVQVYLDEFWQVFLMRINIPVVWFGPFLTASCLAYGLAGSFAHWLKARFTDGRILAVLPLLFGVALILAGWLRSCGGFFFLLLAYLPAATAEPLVTGFLHVHVDSAHRATIESCQSLALRLASAAVGMLFGWVAERWSIFLGYLMLGFFVLVFGVCHLKRLWECERIQK